VESRIIRRDQPRFTGARYVKNWISTPKDLQSVAWVEDRCTVTTEAGEGQDGGNVDKITFNQTHGELEHWVLPHFGRSSESSSPIKFAISFDAKVASPATSGSCRAQVAIMGIDWGSTVRWDRRTFSLTDEWQSFGAILDPVTGKDPKGFDLNALAGPRTLTKFSIESPADGVGVPILVENVNLVILKDGDEEKVSLPMASTIGSTLTLAKTAGSTGTWSNATKAATLSNSQFLDFQDSLEVGKTYLCVLERTSGSSCDVRLQNDRTFWQAYSSSLADTSFVKDGPFTFQYEGGVFKLFQRTGSSTYTVNVYEISDEMDIYGTLNANTISASNVITYTEGAKISSNIAVGVVYETNAVTNMLAAEAHRDFRIWTSSGSGLNRYRSEIGVDARPSQGTILEDARSSSARYLSETVTIPLDTSYYTFSIYVRAMYDGTTQVVFPETDKMVTVPARYSDFSLRLTGGVPVGGQLVRIRLQDGALNATATDYNTIFGIDFDNWYLCSVEVQNNGTNDTAEMRFYPSSSGTFTNPGTLSASSVGYSIVDWAQLENSSVRNSPSGIAIPGVTKAAESVSSTLADGPMYNSIPEEVGDITSNVVTFDAVEIYRNITWIKT
jgi:hypothetical protein